MMDDVTHGELVARLFPDASGKVTRVDVLSAKPTSHARYFEREARRAIRDWRCTLAGQDEAVRQVFAFDLKD